MPEARSRITRSTSRSRAKAPTATPASPANSATWARRHSRGSASLDALDNRGALAMQLEAPAAIEWAHDRLHIGAARLRVAEGHADLGDLRWDGGKLTTRGAFDGIPLTALLRFAGVRSPLASTLVIAGDWSVAATPLLNGVVHVRRERGDLYRHRKPDRLAGRAGAGHHRARGRGAVPGRQRRRDGEAALATRRQRRRHARHQGRGRRARTHRARRADRRHAGRRPAVIASAAAVAGHAGGHRRPRVTST